MTELKPLEPQKLPLSASLRLPDDEYRDAVLTVLSRLKSDKAREAFGILNTLGRGWLHIETKNGDFAIKTSVQIKHAFGPVYVDFQNTGNPEADILAFHDKVMPAARTGAVITVNAGKPDAVSYKYNASPRSRFNSAAIGFVRADAKPQTTRRLIYTQSGPAFMRR